MNAITIKVPSTVNYLNQSLQNFYISISALNEDNQSFYLNVTGFNPFTFTNTI
ncbi:hypothetical protein J6P59_01230 [bacterium]|nr:hypothetical protein [bacterium]